MKLDNLAKNTSGEEIKCPKVASCYSIDKIQDEKQELKLIFKLKIHYFLYLKIKLFSMSVSTSRKTTTTKTHKALSC